MLHAKDFASGAARSEETRECASLHAVETRDVTRQTSEYLDNLAPFELSSNRVSKRRYTTYVPIPTVYEPSLKPYTVYLPNYSHRSTR